MLNFFKRCFKHSFCIGILVKWLAFGLFMALGASAHAIAPANVKIGNQASATYVDANGVAQEVDSNAVVTTIVQIAGVVLDNDELRYSADGERVSMPLTIKNTGNGTDKFTLTQINASNGFQCEPGSIKYYLNNNGLVGEQLVGGVTPEVPSEDSLSLFVECEIPLGTPASQTGQLIITATSQFDTDSTDQAVKTIEVSKSAFDVLKRMDPTNGNAGAVVRVSIEYKNSGRLAEDVTISDELPPFMTYVEESGVWTVDGQVPLSVTDADDGDEGTPSLGQIDYQGNVAGPTNVLAVVRNVPPSTTGLIEFSVVIDEEASAGDIINVAEWVHGVNNSLSGTSAPAIFKVNSDYAVQLTDPQSVDAGSIGADGQDDDGANDVVLISSVDQGGVLYFTNVLINTGNIEDSYQINVDLTSSTFPQGTTFDIQDAGRTPIVNGVTKTLQPGEQYVIVLAANLPVTFSGVSGQQYQVRKSATSLNASNVSDNVTDRVGEVSGNTVDLTNTFALPCSTCGADVGPEASPVTSLSAQPGEVVTFLLYVNNTNSSGPQDYKLSVSGSADMSAALPAGWTAVFRIDQDGVDEQNDADAGNDVTQQSLFVNNLAAGESRLVFAEITIPENADGGNQIIPGATPIYFSVESVLAAAVRDVKYDEIVVSPTRNLTFSQQDPVTVSPGECVNVLYTLQNEGNVVEGDGNSSQLDFGVADSNVAAFNPVSTLYWDRTNPSVFDSADPEIDAAFDFDGNGLAPGESAGIWVQVCADINADTGSVNSPVLTATATDNGVTVAEASVTANVTVVNSLLDTKKELAVDLDCNGVSASDYSVTQVQAKPGECVCYRITATNAGDSNANAVKITDATPFDTTYLECGGSACESNVTSSPGTGGRGTVEGDFGAGFVLAPNEAVSMEFCVKIDDVQ